VAAMVRAESSILEYSGDSVPDAARESTAVLTYSVAKDKTLLDFKREYLKRVLKEAGGVVNQASRLAGLSQSSFRKMMKDVGLSGDDSKPA